MLIRRVTGFNNVIRPCVPGALKKEFINLSVAVGQR